MKEIIVVATRDTSLVRDMQVYFENDLLYSVKFVTENELIDTIKMLTPKFILVDTMYDILEEINNNVDRTCCSIILASKVEEINCNFKVGNVDCLLQKPIDYDILREHLYELKEEQKDKQNLLNKRLTNILLMLGIPANVKGYFQLREAIKLVIHTPSYASAVTTDLYPRLAEIFETTPTKVERTIRHSIEVACNKGTICNIDKVLGIDIFPTDWKPTNSELIALLADRMILEGFSC